MRGGFLGKTRFACPDIGGSLGFLGAARVPGKGAREGPSSLDGNGRQAFASRKDSRAEIAMDAAASSPGSISAKGSSTGAGEGAGMGAEMGSGAGSARDASSLSGLTGTTTPIAIEIAGLILPS
jgi:hypothetical protein